jgi:hypothetical protein
MIRDEPPDVGEANDLRSQAWSIAAQCAGRDHPCRPLAKLVVIARWNSQHLANHRNRQWTPEVADQIHAAEGLYAVQEVVGDVLDVGAELADVLGLEGFVGQASQSGMSWRIGAQHVVVSQPADAKHIEQASSACIPDVLH